MCSKFNPEHFFFRGLIKYVSIGHNKTQCRYFWIGSFLITLFQLVTQGSIFFSLSCIGLLHMSSWFHILEGSLFNSHLFKDATEISSSWWIQEPEGLLVFRMLMGQVCAKGLAGFLSDPWGLLWSSTGWRNLFHGGFTYITAASVLVSHQSLSFIIHGISIWFGFLKVKWVEESHFLREAVF